MEIRQAEAPDRPAIRDVARRSLEASYTLSPEAITSAIEEWYDEQRLEESLGDSAHELLVAERDRQVIAFSEAVHSEEGDEATLLWLHVDPDYRGEGVADAVFDETITLLRSEGYEHIYGRVLDDNTDGNAFYENKGFDKVSEENVDIAGRPHVENVWTLHETTGIEPIETDDGETRYVDYTESETGTKGHFYTVYNDEAGEEQYSYFCANCDELATTMDSMGRMECDRCGNVRTATRWDGAYL